MGERDTDTVRTSGKKSDSSGMGGQRCGHVVHKVVSWRAEKGAWLRLLWMRPVPLERSLKND